MPTYTAPGVYIEEIPSGVRTITGVATSVTAFVGHAPRGPVDRPVAISSFGDYERTFAGLLINVPMSYAVKQFFDNGGSQAIVVRVANGATPAAISLATGGAAPNDVLPLVAASPGTWGNALVATVDHDTRDKDAADPDENLFNLTVREVRGGQTVAVERHFNVSVSASDPRYVPVVLAQGSALVAVNKGQDGKPIVPNVRPGIQADVAATADSGDDGDAVTDAQVIGSENAKTGIFALATVDLFNLLVIPPLTRDGITSDAVYQAALPFCVDKRATLLVDAPAVSAANLPAAVDALSLKPPDGRNAAVYYPKIVMVDPVRGAPASFPPTGAVAGVIARTDGQRGVWKAPAGMEATLSGVARLDVDMTEAESAALNPLGINALRSFPVFGRVVWGARTMAGADQMADDYKYVPVRRLALYIEESLYRGTQWVVFEPNDEPLWAQIRLNVGAFMQGLFRKGAFQGKTPAEAYFVKCDKETTPQADINLGIVNVLVGFAPLKPAEFVIIKIQQIAGQIQT